MQLNSHQENAVAVSMINTAQTVAAAASAASSAASRTSSAANRKSSTASASSAAFPPSPAGSSSSGAFVMRGPSSGLVIPTPEVFTAEVDYEDLYRCEYKFFIVGEARRSTFDASNIGDGAPVGKGVCITIYVRKQGL